MSLLIHQLKDTARWIEERLSVYEEYDEGHTYPWHNKLWRGQTFRRAHLDIVDAVDERKLYMMHLCIFPNTNDPSPIFGFDIIAGPNKVTGAFHDFSPTAGNTHLDGWFAHSVAGYDWSRERELPEWAQNIFSKNIVAAGNIHDEQELAKLLALVKANFTYYLSIVGRRTGDDFTAEQNKYCANQKKNPHTPRVMEALGYEPEVVNVFIHECLFPEIAQAVS